MRATGEFIQRGTILSLLLLCGGGCTDSRQAVEPGSFQPNSSLLSQNLSAPVTLTFDNSPTDALQMAFNGTELILSGTPMGMLGAETGGNPDNPNFEFAIFGTVSIDPNTSSVLPSWSAGNYASGAIATSGNLVYASGDAGMSIFDISNPNFAKEVNRYQPPDQNNVPVPDAAFEFRALAVNPATSTVYGFRQLDYVHVMQMTAGGTQIASQYAINYSSSGAHVCCVNGAATFAGKLFVAFTSKLASMDMAGDGSLANAKAYNQFQAVNVQATANYLYVHHRATFSGPGQNNPTGIYVFNTSGQNVAYFKLDPYRFAVSPDDSRIYANDDRTKIDIYRMSLSGVVP